MNLRGLFHLCVVYIVWGSTYLAIRVAVREGAGFPPFLMAAMRVACASAILLTWGAAARARFRMPVRAFGTLAVSAILLWVGGNGVVAWSEKRIDSGYAALLVASMPLWVTFMEAIWDRRRPPLRLLAALLVGLAGVGVLNGQVILSGSRADIVAGFGCVLAAVSWGFGSLLQRRHPVAVAPEVSSGYQQGVGAVGLLLTAILIGEARPTPVPQAWAAWGYLVVFGSVFAFTSFVKALQLLPTNIVMTYAYVNPVIAVILGWAILDEPITLWTLSGTALVVLGVAGVFHEKRRSGRHRVRMAREAAAQASIQAESPPVDRPRPA